MAITDEAVWHAEERLWLEGGAAYADLVDADAILAMPGEGFTTGAQATAAMKGQPGWASVTMTRRRVFRSHKTVIVLGYDAKGKRPDGSAHEAHCTSTYHAAGDGWRLIQHQQTPVT